MKTLRELFAHVPHEVLQGDLSIEINDIVENSKNIQKNDLFLAVVGTGVDAHDFIPDAVAQGAIAVVFEREITHPPEVTVIKVESSRKAVALLSQAYFDHGQEKLCTIGVTGTCGKTSTTYILRDMLQGAGHKVGIIGSNGCFMEGNAQKTSNTTPSAYEIHRFMGEMVKAGCTHCILEVSSQGIKMDRVYGITFDYGLFTNLSTDHIGVNEHADYEEYRHYKGLFFQQCKSGFLNLDSQDSDYITEKATCPLKTFGFQGETADFHGADVEFIVGESDLATSFTVNGKESYTIHMAGRFSAYNALAALSVASTLGVSPEIMREALKNVQVEGRVEIASYVHGYKIIIDYAHNQAEIASLIQTISEYEYGTLFCVFGAGGNRPKARRYDFAKIAGEFADLSIVTQDNPRFEEFDEINSEIIRGLEEVGGKYVVIEPRKEAIAYAISQAKKGDLILLVGKGHETYLEIKGVKYPWSEKEAILEAEKKIFG